MQERISEGLFLETGGTSTDISVVRRGKVAVRHATILGKASYLSALDVRTVGVGGGSMVRIDGGKVVGVGPRSAHIAGLPYACFATLDELRDARITTVRPMDGDPDDYAVIDAAYGRYAITMTCAANALGRVPEDDFARCDQDVARAALAPLAAALSTDVATAAARLLDSRHRTGPSRHRRHDPRLPAGEGHRGPGRRRRGRRVRDPAPRLRHRPGGPDRPAQRGHQPHRSRPRAGPRADRADHPGKPARNRSSPSAPRPRRPSSPRAPPPTAWRWR